MNWGMDTTQLQPAIRGKIADLLDYPVASARVVLCGSKLSEKLSTMTGLEGSFMFSRVPPGVYTLEVRYSGFHKLVQRGIAVLDNAITGLDMKMNFQEDSRSLKLQSLHLNIVNDGPDAGLPGEPPSLPRQLHEVVAGLRVDKALFNPPSAVTVGRRTAIEFGLFQNLKDTITRRLLDRRVSLPGNGEIKVSLLASLQVAGVQVLPRSLPRTEIDRAQFVEWRWDLLPQVPGRTRLRLSLHAAVEVRGLERLEKSLLSLEREVVIRRNRWLSWTRALKNIVEKENRAGHFFP